MMNETETKTEIAGVQDRNSGMEDRNEEEELRRQRQGITTIKNKKSNQKHKSKPETMNQREYEEVIFGDVIPPQDDITTLIRGVGIGKKRKPRKVVDEPAEPTASEIALEVAVPLTMEESLFGNQQIDAVAEPDEVIAIMTEEDCLLAEAELMMRKAEGMKREAQRRIAEKKLRENVGELREKDLLIKRGRADDLRDEILHKQKKLDKLMKEIEEIEKGEKDDELIENAIKYESLEVIESKREKPKVEGKRASPTKKERRSSVLFKDEELLRHNATRGGVLLNTIYCYYEATLDKFQLCDEESNPIGDTTFENLNQFIIYNNKQYVPEKVQRETAWAGSVCVFRDEKWISIGKL